MSGQQVLICLALSTAAGACTDADLGPAGQGETLPVPDMSKITFAEDSTQRIVLTGTDGAVEPNTLLRVTNLTLATRQVTAASESGAFSVLLVDAGLGNRLQLTVLATDQESVPTEMLLLFPAGTRPPEPSNIVVTRTPPDHPSITISGTFLGELRAVEVRVAAEATGSVVQQSTAVSAEGRTFSVSILAAHGDALIVYAVEPASGLTGPFVAASAE